MNADVAREELKFGIVKIWWVIAKDMTPIGVYHQGLNGHKVYCLNCDLHYEIGDYDFVVPMFYKDEAGEWIRWTFDGQSTPWFLRWLPGFEALSWHIWAVIPHDYFCDFKWAMRSIGDAVFLEVNKAVKPDKYWNSVLRYVAVWSYTAKKKIAGI